MLWRHWYDFAPPSGRWRQRSPFLRFIKKMALACIPDGGGTMRHPELLVDLLEIPLDRPALQARPSYCPHCAACADCANEPGSNVRHGSRTTPLITIQYHAGDSNRHEPAARPGDECCERRGAISMKEICSYLVDEHDEHILRWQRQEKG